jgi:DNA-binding transcriptional regulator YiaG
MVKADGNLWPWVAHGVFMGNSLKALRQAIQMAGSQSALAKELEVGRSNVSKWVSWGKVPASQALRIEILYGIPAASFFKKK